MVRIGGSKGDFHIYSGDLPPTEAMEGHAMFPCLRQLGLWEIGRVLYSFIHRPYLPQPDHLSTEQFERVDTR